MTCRQSNTAMPTSQSCNRRVVASAAGLLLLAAVVGCATDGIPDISVPSIWPGGGDDEASPKTPSRLITSWTHTVLHRTGQRPQRGFGGRLLFFDQGSEESVRVAGQLVIYAFDETDRAAHDTQPTRRYIYPPEQFARLESPSKLGPSYSVWVPWDDVGGQQKHISLIARFEPVEGPLIVGEQTRHFLPGAMAATPESPKPTVQLATHEAELPRVERKIETAKLRTTSIPAPRRMTQR